MIISQSKTFSQDLPIRKVNLQNWDNHGSLSYSSRTQQYDRSVSDMKEKMTNVNKNSVIDTDIRRFPLEHPRISVVCEDMLAISNLTKKQSSMRRKLFPQKQATPWIVYTIWSSGISAQLTFYLQNAHTVQDCIQTRTLSLCNMLLQQKPKSVTQCHHECITLQDITAASRVENVGFKQRILVIWLPDHNHLISIN